MDTVAQVSVSPLKAKLQEWPAERVLDVLKNVTLSRVDDAIEKESRTVEDLAVLLSPCARQRLEVMARQAQRLTRSHFGRTITLYAPIYLSNVCAADCLYCGFATGSGNREKRLSLKSDELRRECVSLVERGFDTTLLLTGEAPRIASPGYIAEGVAVAREYLSSVSAEVYAMETEEYALLCRSGLDGITLYMETYNEEQYRVLHRAGVKKDYDFRLNALDRAGAAGVRKLNLGALLGLSDWRVEGLHMGIHARHLQHVYWRSAVAISFPRLRHTPKRFAIPVQVSDADLVQLMLALRLCLPEAGFTLSTRETAGMRDRLIPLGITMMSAGSSTRPGGYATCGNETLEQFEIEDSRTPPEIVEAIRRAGYDPVWKDYDRAFC